MEHLSSVVARQTHIDNPEDQEMMERIVDAICQVYDPEIPALKEKNAFPPNKTPWNTFLPS